MGELITPSKIQPGILYIDHRELTNFPFDEYFAELCSVPIEIAQLRTGDVVFEDICFERKTVNDFVGSFIPDGKHDKGRIFNQSERMLEGFKKQYVFVTQTLDEYTGNVHRHCILGALARLLVNGVDVCFGITDEEDYVYLVLKTLEKEGKLKVLQPKKKKENF